MCSWDVELSPCVRMCGTERQHLSKGTNQRIAVSPITVRNFASVEVEAHSLTVAFES